MKFIFITVIALLLWASPVQARNDVLTLPLTNLLTSTKAKEALLDVPIYFSGQSTPAIAQRREITVSRKTNALNKSDEEACEWVMLTALKALQNSARKGGYDAVANIKSNYQHSEFASSTEFQCGAGTIVSGVALKADLVRFE